MKNGTTIFFALFLFNIFTVFSENPRTTITLTGTTVTVSSYTDKEVIINGATGLHLTSTSPFNNSIVKLNSQDSWVYFDNVRPQGVIDSLLSNVLINEQAASYNSNCRVAIYKHGTVVIPQSPTFQPLTVYSGENYGGDSNTAYSTNTKYGALGSFDNSIRSFKLKRGYQVTFATSSNGMGYSRVYIADDKDLEVPSLPSLLSKKISFIRIMRWEWVTKKGWCGSDPNQYIPLKTTWRYDWSASGNTTAAVEYVPIRQNGGWPGWDVINTKDNVTHLLGFNEPDHVEQSNLTVSQALAQWPNMLQTGLRLGSPACTNFSWLYQFLDSCKAKNYRVDYVAVHAYWGGKSPQNWYNDLKYIHERSGGRPIWITEWNNGANWTTESWPTSDHSLSAENAAKQLNDIKKILEVLDTAHFIERHSIYNWVQDCRAMVLNGQLTPAGEYYAADNSVMAYNPVNEIIPGFIYGNPTLSVAYGTKNLSLVVSDPNFENFDGCYIEKKVGDGEYSVIFDSNDTYNKTFTDTLNLGAESKVRYRMRSKLANGSLSNYSNEVGFDISNGNGHIQYGNMSVANVDWNALFFKNEYSSTPSIIVGAPTNNNFTALLTPRVKVVNPKTRTNIQLIPWSYQNISTISKEDKIPYFILPSGTYDLGGLKAIAGKGNTSGSWSSITFDTPFETEPAVFVSQLLSSTAYATTVRVRNITKTGFEVKTQKETAISATLPSEMFSYVAITPGTGKIDDKTLIVGKTADKAVSNIYTSIMYGDSISNPVFLSQMQTCNDDTVTAALRCLSISEKYANVVKQRERSAGQSITVAGEMVGWMVISSQPMESGLDNTLLPELKCYPNPVKEILYFSRDLKVENSIAEIYSITGTLLKQLKLTDSSINVSDLPSGLYYVKMKGYRGSRFIKY